MKIDLIPWRNGQDKLNPGEGYLTKLEQNGVVKLAMWYCCHICHEEVLVSDHNVTMNPDGTVTVTPSLVCPTKGCTGHYFITNSEIQ